MSNQEGQVIDAGVRVDEKKAIVFPGIKSRNNRWLAYVQFEGKRKYIGTFETPTEAIRAQVAFKTEHGLLKPRDEDSENAPRRKRPRSEPSLDDHERLRGISVRNGRWVAYVQSGGKRMYVGSYSNPDEAISAQIQFRENNNLPPAGVKVPRAPRAPKGELHITGVVQRAERWIAFVQLEGRRTYVGSYDSIYDAVVGQEEFRARHGLVEKPETTVAKARANKKALNLAAAPSRVVKAARVSLSKDLPTGVARCGPKFHSYLQYDNRRKYIGSYDSVDEALLAQQEFRETHNLPYPTERKQKTFPVEDYEFSPEEEEEAASKTGIIARGGRWLAFIQYLGKRHYVGSYASAAQAYTAQTKFREDNPGANVGPDSARLSSAAATYIPTQMPTFSGYNIPDSAAAFANSNRVSGVPILNSNINYITHSNSQHMINNNQNVNVGNVGVNVNHNLLGGGGVNNHPGIIPRVMPTNVNPASISASEMLQAMIAGGRTGHHSKATPDSPGSSDDEESESGLASGEQYRQAGAGGRGRGGKPKK